uniref:Laminin, beta 2-like n=1 Tax=Tetraodon nigroviridis TaxID=99883 RepID=H3CA06_TETNG
FLLSLPPPAAVALGQELPSAPHGCAEGGCYPATGNLLIGRAANLSATSTCGLRGPEQYCIVSHLQESDKCFECNSQVPGEPGRGRSSHRIENVIYLTDSSGEETWWQSVNGQENVSIRLNLEAEFHFTHLIMKFKTFRPAAMIIERSADFGHSWRPYRYFASNCSRTFPGISAKALQRIDDIICEERYSDIEPSTNGEDSKVIYKVLDPHIHVKDPYSLDIQELLRITNLRINFTKLNTLGDDLLDRRSDVLQKYYYAIFELVVRGSCFCYGHASECAPIPGVDARQAGMIHGRCLCKHNTEGLNCERCKGFHHQLPWRPAEAENPHTCRECDCNGHSDKCHFDMAVYLATANTSGGVCDDCSHHTTGRNCELCKPFYYQDPSRDIRDQHVCVACDCDPAGSLEEGLCDSHTDVRSGMIAGQCRCKAHVRGARCDGCMEGFYGLSSSNPLGCESCNCDPRGTLGETPCDQISGDCACKRYVTGRYCNQCLPEFWGLSNDRLGCRPCDCDFGGAYNNRIGRCLMENGQCDCRKHLIGRQCSAVQPGFFCAPLDHYRYEAEDAAGRSPGDPLLPVSTLAWSQRVSMHPRSFRSDSPIHPPRVVQGREPPSGLPQGKERPQAETDCVQHLSNQLRRHRRHRHVASVWQQRAALRRIRQLQQTVRHTLCTQPDVSSLHRDRSLDRMVSWTGPGFARVKDGAGLVFTVEDVPYAMDYDILIRYEPESTEDWEAVVSVTSELLPSSLRCGNLLPTEQLYTAALPHRKRFVQMTRPFCFEPSNRYVLVIRFQRQGVSHRHLTAFILVDSLVLIPKYTELAGFHGNKPEAERRRKEMEDYMCLDSFLMTPTPALAEVCSTLICSISSILHDGALPCQCDPQGSLSSECSPVGGQCPCKAHVVGQHCDRCAPGTYGFGVNGCAGECLGSGGTPLHPPGWAGQCRCRHGAVGRRCSDCQAGQWGFPSCSPCQCNGHADLCHPHTGECRDCRDNTAGRQCERCVDGFFGNPVLGSGEHCRPCPCPGSPSSGHFNAHSCQAEPTSDQITCNCKPGYTGPRCNQCAPGYYGNPEEAGGQCQPCQCNGNIDPDLDPESCDPRTGQCLKCLHHTEGPSCAQCQLGYYGNALAQDCRRCVCVTSGTKPSACSEGRCHCDRQSGACPCREHVEGHICDHCAPHHWNYGQAGGCQPCACDPDHAMGAHCNMFSGQCHCQPGFGGRQCTECEQFHWGDPREQCQECNCHLLGSEVAQCDQDTGKCKCKVGMAGKRCDQCARGFVGPFPTCAPCHPCFQLWDDTICQLERDLENIQLMVKKVVESSGTPGFGHMKIRKLEMKLMQVKNLLSQVESQQIHHLIGQSIEDLRAEIAVTDGHLTAVSRELNTSAETDAALRDTLALMERQLTDINATTDALMKVKKYHRESEKAEEKCNATVTLIKDLLEASQDKLFQDLAAHNRSIEELQGKAQELDRTVHLLTQKVCGAPDSTSGVCTGSQCGGEGCNGTVSVSVAAMNNANNVRDHLTAADEDLQGVNRQLKNIASLTLDVKNQVKHTLEKAQKNKQHFETGNRKLKDFIQKIRDFLMEEGADPASIERVAQHVLSITLPVPRSTLEKMILQIKDSLANITDVGGIVNHSSQHITKAKELLSQAKDANLYSTVIVNEISKNRFVKAIEKDKIIQRTKAQAEELKDVMTERLTELEDKQMDIMIRLNNLSMATGSLRNKTEKNREMAKEAKSQADNATMLASSLEQVLNDTEERYKTLQEKVGSLTGESGNIININKKAMEMKSEAEELLDKARKKIDQLRRLERKFRSNEQQLQKQRVELDELKENVTLVRDEIRKQVQKYSSC